MPEQTKRILVVDDEISNRELLQDLLELFGYQVFLAPDGVTALEMVQTIDPDVILLDIMMPKMDGLEVARRLKASEQTKDIPIVMVTALDAVADRVKALEAGASDFLAKPVDRLELKATVQTQVQVKAYYDHLKHYQQELETEVARRTEQLRQREQALRQSEEKYRLLVQQIPAVVYKGHADWSGDFFNDKIEALTGYRKEDFDSRTVKWIDLVITEDFPIVEATFNKALQENKSYNREYRIRKQDGEIRWIQDLGQKTCAADGQPAHTSGVLFDITERKQLEGALQESELFLNETQRIGRLGGWKANPATDYLKWTDGVYEIIEAPRDYPPGLTEGLKFYLPEYIPRLREKVGHCLDTGEPFTEQCQVRTTSGQVLWTEVRGLRPLGKNVESYVIGTFQDITERKQAEAALRASEERLRLKLDAILSPDVPIIDQDLSNILNLPAVQSLLEDFSKLTNMVTAILDLQGKVLVATGWQDICTQYHRVNPVAARACTESDLFLGRNLKAGDFTAYKCKNHLWDIVTPLYMAGRHIGNIFTGQFFYEDEIIDEQIFIDQAVKYGFAQEAYLAALKRVPHLSRERVQTLMDFLIKFSDLIVKLSYSNLNLAKAKLEQERIADAFRQSEEMNKAILRTAMDGYWQADLQGRLKVVNEAYCRMSGYSEAELLTMNILNLEALETTTDIEERMQAIMACSEMRFESMHRRKDGSTFTVEACVQYRPIAGGRMVVFLRDISERKQAEAARKQLEAQLFQAQKMEAIGTLAGGIAHDFNNILMAIMGYTEMAKAAISTDTKVGSYLNQVIQASNRAKELVQQILTFSRRADSEKKPLLIGPIIKEAIKLLRASLPVTIEIHQQINNKNSILADATQIHQIIMNLATNAYHALQKSGGELQVRLNDVVLTKKIPASSGELPIGSYLQLEVQDNGIGMEKEIQERIFEPYFTTKEMGEGTGLGLATVLGIVKSHGGDILVKSVVGQGTTFTIYFPALEQKSVEQQVLSSESQLEGTGNILFVDDEQVITDFVKEALTNIGYEVIATTSSLEALDLFSHSPQKFDLVITDLTMPKLTGLNLTEQLLKIRSNIPIILCTGYGDKYKKLDLMGSGIRELLIKPLGISRLAEVIQRILRAESPINMKPMDK